MAWYVDTSAYLKLVVEEPESRALKAWLRGPRSGPRPTLFSSALLRVEALRAARRHSTAAHSAARQRLDALTLVDFDDEMYELAADLDPAILRSLDALHLAAALRAGDELDGVLSYDERMIEAAELHGVTTASPGH